MESRKQLWRALFFIFLITALCGGMALPALDMPARAAPPMQISTPLPGEVVISEFRVRGPNGGNDEFIEIYNRTNAVKDISGLEIWGSTSTGVVSSKATIPAGTLLESGQYYLITNANNSNGPYSGVTPGNLTYSSGIADTGGIALLQVAGSVIIDQVGMTNCAGCYFETTQLASLGNTQNLDRGYERKLGGASDSCQDTDNNANDFQLINPSNPQNLSSPLSLCGAVPPTATSTDTPTDTGTATDTGTVTNTITSTGSPTNTSPAPAGNVVISEFRAAGPNGGNDEFVELYNRSKTAVSIGSWIIKKSTGCGTSTSTVANIPAGVTLAPGQHYLIGGNTYTGSVTPDQKNVPLSIAADGGVALFKTNGVTIVDQVGMCATTLFHEGTALAALSGNTNRSYDRKPSASGICRDSNNNKADFIARSPSDPQNSSSKKVCANPTLTPTTTRTPTHTRTPTRTRTPIRTPTPRPPQPLIAINEFVPRPGHDWNGDGVVNTGDEFIELLNHGVIDVNLSGYTLDDEVNIGSTPYRLPSVTLSPGERIVFYGSQTNLLLSDGGDGVRLIKPNGQLGDAYNYRLARFPDQSYCRLPDNGGLDDWNEDCFPTPGLQNSLRGVANPSVAGSEDLCPIADTLPADFVLAECPPFGNNIWNSDYWDRNGWFGERFLPKSPGKWNLFVD